MDLKIVAVINEQVVVRFTGRVNVLSTFNRQYLGHLLFKDGELFQVIFQNHTGLKAFYQLIIQEYSLDSFSYVVEPELVEDQDRKIHYPMHVLKNKMKGVLKLYRSSLLLRPPDSVKILTDASFVSGTVPVSQQEFEVLECLTEWSRVNDIYQHCPLFDHEITLALVSLRKKGALKIMSSENNH